MEHPAVVLEGANKFYGRKDKPDYKSVLSNLNMTVEKGIIYGLLGPSGCGKTTLLSCIVGRRKLDSGNVWVLGGKPGEKGSGVPGPRVGYMPQEIALVGEFTVRDAVYYFGRIYGMSHKKMAERFEFLSQLLDLPGHGRAIKTLSGGQQRRVSLAAALVHDPELLILDEPTVGLDPVLREKIWNFLAEVAQKGSTVIITTHYIDETKQADKIGLLRDGQLLAEDSPNEILRRFQCQTLEEAFFKMALRQQENTQHNESTSAISPNAILEPSQNDSCYQSREDFNVISSSTDVLTKKEKPKKLNSKPSGRYKAIFIKSFQQFVRNPNGLMFSLTFPMIQLFCLFIAIGHDPRDVTLAIVNDEAASTALGKDTCKYGNVTYVHQREDDSCEQYMLSCWFLEEMEKRNLFSTPYNSTADAKNAVATRKLYAALHFPLNFSNALSLRVTEGRVDDEVIDDSTISAWIDMTEQQISNHVKTQLHKVYEAFAKRTMRACGKNEDLIQIPVHFATPIYGKMDTEVIDYMAPGVMITIIFFMPTLVTSTLMISDRLEGVWERSAVAGVRAHEMLYVHIVLQTCIIVIQTLETVALAFGGFQLESVGSLFSCFAMLLLQGLSGMSFGFLLSVFCSSFTVSFFVATGSFYPMILLCGILWPLEGMPRFLRYIAYALPFTIPSRSLRDIMTKGSSLISPEVLIGVLITFVWIALTLSLCIIRLKMKKT